MKIQKHTFNEQMLLLFVQKLFDDTEFVNYYDSDLLFIIDKYQTGELNRDIDEKGAGGFWDLAGELAEYQHLPLGQCKCNSKEAPTFKDTLDAIAGINKSGGCGIQLNQEGFYNTMLYLYEIPLK
ncbi:hypothetical protein CMI37_13210 [Candidatus Pacearchaeota archaeon]|nr:hypothetical protein [Candidatus Pacearchaeota archaeon]|tara:strand:- start:1709 stop:2083 length:375 start_codon:yes stop_codon:yes gene_type:complete